MSDYRHAAWRPGGLVVAVGLRGCGGRGGGAGHPLAGLGDGPAGPPVSEPVLAPSGVAQPLVLGERKLK